MKISYTSLDQLFSDVIHERDRWQCQRCGNTNASSYQTMHYETRGNKKVRYDEDNAACGCGGCHLYLSAHPKAEREFFLQLLGTLRFEALEIRAEMRHVKIDREAIRIYLLRRYFDLTGHEWNKEERKIRHRVAYGPDYVKQGGKS